MTTLTSSEVPVTTTTTRRNGERGKLVDRMVKTLTNSMKNDNNNELGRSNEEVTLNSNKHLINQGSKPDVEGDAEIDKHESQLTNKRVRKFDGKTTIVRKSNSKTDNTIKNNSNIMRLVRQQGLRPTTSRLNLNQETDIKEIYAQAANSNLSNGEMDQNDDLIQDHDDDDDEDDDDDDELQHQYNQQRLRHAPNCSVNTTGTKLVHVIQHNEDHQIKHKTHCIHHNPSCNRNQLQHQHIHQDRPKLQPAPMRQPQIRQSDQQQQPYLLIEYQSRFGNHKNRYMSPTFVDCKQTAKANNNRKTTLSFISQLYFLLHLSAILSLLLHHKNLVTSDRKLLQSQQPNYPDYSEKVELNYAPKNDNNETNQLPLPTLTADSIATTSLPVIVNPLPVPQTMLDANSRQQDWRPNNQIVNSYSPKSTMTSNHNEQQQQQHRERRQILQLQGYLQSDILVRLVGWWHAKHALQYFLFYLLSSSVTILLCLWLFKLCLGSSVDSQSPATECNIPRSDADPSQLQAHTYLDCTPVLIGSISLGLIQLIVIGLDIADNIDWLSEARWPIYLPFLQFAFVSLLMQFILGKVAKNHAAGRRLRQQHQMPINGRPGKRNENIEIPPEFSLSSTLVPLKATVNQTNNTSTTTTTSRSSPISNGLQNIALAHLLVTHILLWLMRLNSITLFQPIEQQQQQQNHQHHQRQFNYQSQSPQQHNVHLLRNHSSGLYHRVHSNQNDTQSSTRQMKELPKLPVATTSTSTTTTTTTSTTTTTQSPADSMINQLELLPPNRTEFETNPRRKATRGEYRVQSSSPPPPLPPSGSTTGPPRPLIEHSERENPKTSGNSEEFRSSVVKNERGLRSTANKTTPSTVSVGLQLPAPVLPFNLTRLIDKSESNQVRNTPSKPDVFTLTQAELLSLINLAKTNSKQRQPIRVEEKQTEPVNGNSVASFKSSLPKRMTAFRQARPRGPTTNTTSLPPTLIATRRPPTSTTTSTSTTRRPKEQRTRVTVSRITDDLDNLDLRGVLPARPNSEDRQPRMFKANFSSIEAPISTTNRPFPSVESDPPREESQSTTTSTTIKSFDEEDTTDPLPTTTIAGNKKAEMEPTTTVQPSSQESEESSTESDDESDMDLDALLPPVPNYDDLNQTTDTQEEPFLFNEAATESVPVNLTTTMTPEVPNVNVSHVKDDRLDIKPISEPLTRQQQNSLLSFADYLLPIVHQYYILVMAILFHMWIDSLYQSSHYSRRLTTNEEPNNQRQTGDISKRLIAVPMKPSRLKMEANSHGLSGSNISHYSMGMHNAKLVSRWPQNQRRKYLTANQHSDDSSASNSSSHRELSMRSSSSEQLLWAHGENMREKRIKRPSHFPQGDETLNMKGSRSKEEDRVQGQSSNSACSVFFGLLIVSGSLIVMLLGIELLSMLTQCLTQLLSILVCLIGLCIVWRSKTHYSGHKVANKSQANSSILIAGRKSLGIDRRQCFHYLFLLAAYYCGLSTALNLGKQNSIQQLFPQQVVQFVQRHILTNDNQHRLLLQLSGFEESSRFDSSHKLLVPINLQVLFHAAVAIKGLILVVQVTLQTMLIRSSWQSTRLGRLEMRQIYTFLMFTNLSLWALDICEQQRHLQHDQFMSTHSWVEDQNHELITLDGFTRFANSFVTLSHLYHGLVFLQQ